MKVLFITYELPPIGGGGGRAAWQIARRLVARGHEVAILTSHFRGLDRHEESEGVHIRRVRVRRKRADACTPRELVSFMWHGSLAASRAAGALRPDVVCAFFGIPGGPPAWWACRRRRIPYVLSLRGSDVPRPELSKFQHLHRFTRPVLRRVWRDAAGLVAVSEALREAALGIQPGLSIEVIPNGVDTELFRLDGERPGQGRPPGLLYVGRLQEFKGVQHVLRALPQIEGELGGPVRFTIVGDGPYRPALESLAAEIRSNGAASEVHFTGWIEQSRLRSMYASASLLLLPSLVEGHPNVIIEGMAMGLPCVASDVPGIREVVRPDHGILVRPEDPSSIARAVAGILSDEGAWRAMSRCARVRAREFSWDAVARGYETVLHSAVGRLVLGGGPLRRAV